MKTVLAQVPVPPVQDVQSGEGGLVGTVVAIVLAATFVALMVLALRKALKRRGQVEKAPLQAVGEAREPVLPQTVAPPKVELPPSELEARKRAEAEAKRAEAEAAKARLAELEVQKAQAEAAQRAALEAEQQRLRGEVEAAKKEAYRAKKAAEAEEKERHKREREEAERLAREEEARKAAEAARLEAERKEAERRKIEAEAGQTLAAGLAKTKKEGFVARLNGLFGGAPKAIDEQTLAELEEVLFTADIGVRTASRLVELAREKAKAKELDQPEKLKAVIRAEVEKIVDLKAPHDLQGGGPPHVIMVVGVNGAGKTTTIGKLAAKAKAAGKKVLLGAGDTFRAAAIEQLDVWAERAGVDIVKGKEDADPASVVFDAVKKGVAEGYDLVIADTAGRLHTKTNLMEELKKVRRVVGKALPGAPHEVLLVLDSTNGQNAIAQAKQFQEAVGVTSIALTKLDGTAKGGVIIGICDELKVPVAWAGVGEKVADLRPFEPKEFVQALFD
jgi:fused signal recognition particle receptor